MGTNEVVVIEHTRCGLLGVREDEVRASLAESLDVTADDIPIVFGAFDDLEANLRAQVAILREHQLLRSVAVHGLIFDVATGRLHEIE
jgi:carbonic anhydrase